LLLEDCILRLYGINNTERQLIVDEINRLNYLSAVNDMKFKTGGAVN